MIVVVDADGVRVQEADTLTALKVATRLPRGETLSALRAAGLTTNNLPPVNTEVVLTVATLRGLAEDAATRVDWAAAWTAMIAFATDRGWVLDGGAGVLAHVESTELD